MANPAPKIINFKFSYLIVPVRRPFYTCVHRFFVVFVCQCLSPGLFFQRHVVRCPVFCLSPCHHLPLSSCAFWICAVCGCGVCRCLWLCVVALCCVVLCCGCIVCCCVCVCVFGCGVSHTLSRSRYTYTHRCTCRRYCFLLIDLPQWFHGFLLLVTVSSTFRDFKLHLCNHMSDYFSKILYLRR